MHTETSYLANKPLSAEWQKAGAVKIPQLLTSTGLDACRDFYNWVLANPSSIATQFHKGATDSFYNDAGSAKGYYPHAEALFEACPGLGQTAQALFGSENQNIWFLGYEVFHKSGGAGRHTPFHQDTAFAPFHGKHMVRFWIPFEPVDKAHCLQVVSGSHRGPLFNPNKVLMTNPSNHEAAGIDDTTPFFDSEDALRAMPRVPDILANPEAHEILSWDLALGDVVAFHLGTLHGNAPVDVLHPERNTLILGFIGDDCIYKPLPVEGSADFVNPQAFVGLEEGDHFSLSGSNKRIRLRGAGLAL
ncbi:MAG: phytanoyl-CoA dioxygenase family protein [Pseudomonadota bacterium]